MFSVQVRLWIISFDPGSLLRTAKSLFYKKESSKEVCQEICNPVSEQSVDRFIRTIVFKVFYIVAHGRHMKQEEL